MIFSYIEFLEINKYYNWEKCNNIHFTEVLTWKEKCALFLGCPFLCGHLSGNEHRLILNIGW